MSGGVVVVVVVGLAVVEVVVTVVVVAWGMAVVVVVEAVAAAVVAGAWVEDVRAVETAEVNGSSDAPSVESAEDDVVEILAAVSSVA